HVAGASAGDHAAATIPACSATTVGSVAIGLMMHSRSAHRCERLRSMPWAPELFSAPLLERIRSHAADARAAEPVPYFTGVASGETEALVRSFSGVPELHHPLRGRVKGEREFERFIATTNTWLNALNAEGGEVSRIVTPQRAIEETVMKLDRAG